MKKLIVLLILFQTFFSFSQSELKFINPLETLNSAVSFYSDGSYYEAIREIDKLNPNDSVYLSALTVKVRALLELEKYDELIKICKENLKTKSIYTSDFYLYKGIAELRKEEFENSVVTFQQYIVDYPTSYIAYYNLSVAFKKLKKYDKEIESLQKVIYLNPYYSYPHLELGLLCANEGLITQAILAFDTYLFISPDAENSLSLLVYMNDLVANKKDLEPKNISISADDKAFEEIDLIVNNYAALSKKYKIPIKIKEPVIKQNHAIMEKLSEFEGNGGFWDKVYVPFYKEVYENGYFDVFSYRIMLSTSNKKYQKIISKNKTKQKQFVTWAAGKWLDIAGKDREKDKNGNLLSYYYYNSGELFAIGKQNKDENFTGPCKFFYSKGDTSAIGSYKDNEKDGLWKWYNEKGGIKETAMYDNKKLNGQNKVFFDNGQLKSYGINKDNNFDGQFYKYNRYGALLSNSAITDGKANGNDSIFYKLGKNYIKFIIPYRNDTIDGKAIQYFDSGEIQMVIEFKGGKRQNETNYYRNGQVYSKYIYKDGVIDGDFISYFETGELSEKGQFIDGNKTGEWLNYFINGSLYSKSNYDEKGRLTGLYSEYSRDGKLYYEFKYKKDDVIEYTYFDKSGNIIKQASKKNGKFYYEGYYTNGVISTEGNYLLDGGKDGLWKYYNEYGHLTSTENYDEGKLIGEKKEFFTNAESSSVIKYKDGKEDGYYRNNYIDGSIYNEGYYVDGLLERTVRYYYPDGTLSGENFFFHDNLYGDQYFYTETGKLYYINHYENEEHIRTSYFDTTGELIDIVDYYNPLSYSRHYHNGNIYQKREYLYGILHGAYTAYHFNGKISIEGGYFNSNRHGKWSWYNDTGQLTKQGEYYYGKPIGTWNYYFDSGKLKEVRKFKDGMIEGEDLSYNEDGKLVVKENYFKDKRHGPTFWYSEKGNFQIVRYYNYGILIGYSYEGSDGEILSMTKIEKGTAKLLCYYRNGQISRDFEFLNGLLHGSYKEYHENGQLAEKHRYEYGFREGKDLVYFDNGQLRKVGHYLHDAKHGKFVEYYKNGNIKSIVYYLNNLPTGTAIFYDNEGNLIKKENYFGGEIYDVEYM